MIEANALTKVHIHTTDSRAFPGRRPYEPLAHSKLDIFLIFQEADNFEGIEMIFQRGMTRKSGRHV